MIPKLIHQTWRTSDVSSYHQGDLALKSQKSLQKTFPDFKYKLWTDQDLEDLVSLPRYEFIREMFHKVRPIKKADIGRYMIVNTHGGYYFDLDCLMHAKFPKFNKEFVGYKAVRPKWTKSGRKKNWVLGNAFFGACPDHPLLELMLKEIAFDSRKCSRTHCVANPMHHTGPDRLDEICAKYKLWHMVRLLEPSEFENATGDNEPKYGVHKCTEGGWL